MKEIKFFLKHWGYEASGIIVVISMFFASKEYILLDLQFYYSSYSSCFERNN